jgi:hypothetical protein
MYVKHFQMADLTYILFSEKILERKIGLFRHKTAWVKRGLLFS